MLAFCLVMLLVPEAVELINRPANKIALTQIGFTQFIQYDVETPPLREFTLCVWIRLFKLTGDQSIFTYLVNGNNHMRVWIDSGGRNIKVSVNGEASSNIAVEISTDTWRHVCLSYQSDYGAWALYVDGRLASCEAAQSLYGFVLPGGGSFIVGYEADKNGMPKGLEGEVYGVNVILTSTIERNHTIKKDPKYQQKPFDKNKLANDNIKYVVLGQQAASQTSQYVQREKKTALNSNRSFIRFKSPYSEFDHYIGSDVKSMQTMDSSNELEIIDVKIPSKNKHREGKINFWNLINEAGKNGKFKGQNEQLSSSTKDVTISEFETPPPLEPTQEYMNSDYKNKLFENNNYNITSANLSKNRFKQEALDVEKPPPVEQDTKVYGQWSKSFFANDVLNYLKSINLNKKKQKKIPATIPLLKISDTFPYASDFKVTKTMPFRKFQRRNLMDKHLEIHKRETRHPEINVKILKNNFRTQILEEHAKTHPNNVQIINRGANTKYKGHRFYRNVHHDETSEEQVGSKEFDKLSYITKSRPQSQFNNHKQLQQMQNSNSLINTLPFLKSNEYFIGDYRNSATKNNKNKMYANDLSSANKWHNVKTYSNDYAPRMINLEPNQPHGDQYYNLAKMNEQLPSIRLKYRPELYKLKNDTDAAIDEGRVLAIEISNSSNPNNEMISILKYNHGYLPYQNSNNTKPASVKASINREYFNHNIKIGNALNERSIIGERGEHEKRSFFGGNEDIPDVNRYRSDIDNTNDQVPASLSPRICKNIELFDRLFYVQPDGSVDVTSILSPVKGKNLGIEFVIDNYKKCSLEDSTLEKNSLLLIHWSKTPVRLFGGAKAKKTRDLCGFF